MYPIMEEHEITSGYTNMYLAIDRATGFTQVEKLDEGITVTPILQTSDRGYLVGKDVQSINSINSKNSKKGQYILGATVTKSLENGKESKMVAYSSSYTFATNQQLELSSYANANVVMNSIYWACDIDSSRAISIPEKTFVNQSITMDQSDAILWILITLIIVPIIILVLGFFVWIRRRRR